MFVKPGTRFATGGQLKTRAQTNRIGRVLGVILQGVLLFVMLPRPLLLIAAPSGELSFDEWRKVVPISFQYDGHSSSSFLSSWPSTLRTEACRGGLMHRLSYIDPTTKLEVTIEIRTFSDFDATDWVVRFRNPGLADSPIISEIEPLNWELGSADRCILHSALGSSASVDDFRPQTQIIDKGQTLVMQSSGGRSSSITNLPFFNLQMGQRGIVGAIGWTGNWRARFASSDSSGALRLTAGMKRTHLVLHPGEDIRTPRIVLLNWQGGDWQESQNLWRRFVLTYYSPQENGRPLVGPVADSTWGTDPAKKKLGELRKISTERLPFDVYWVDAGWYGHCEGEGDAGNSPWWRNRGSWEVNPVPFPQGLTPVASAARAAKQDFLLWLEPEEADPGTTLRVQHPDWFFMPPQCNNPGTALLRLGDPVVRRNITALVSRMIEDTGMAWYRQDFNCDPERSWATADAPDRVGMAEIRHIEGLYAFWDELLEKHPTLKIDNCASGGRRLDIETISRCFSLSRSDLAGTASDPIGSQAQTQALAPWVPLNTGAPWLWLGREGPPFDAAFIYTLRSGFSSAYGLGLGSPEGKSSAWYSDLRKILAEYREVQPFFYGDLHPLIGYNTASDTMAASQWCRSGGKAGLAIVFRRPDCPYPELELGLIHIDPKARYEVEIRLGLDRTQPMEMLGDSLLNLRISIPTRPGSALVFYTQVQT